MVSKVKSENIRAIIDGLLPDLMLREIYWSDSTCPECGDDSEFYFITDHQYSKVSNKGYLSGGFCCTSCGFANGGAMSIIDLPKGDSDVYPHES